MFPSPAASRALDVARRVAALGPEVAFGSLDLPPSEMEILLELVVDVVEWTREQELRAFQRREE